jgi:hypothetical protein
MNTASTHDRSLTIARSRCADTRRWTHEPTSRSFLFLLAGITTTVTTALIAVFAGLHLGAPGASVGPESWAHPAEVIAMPATADAH